MFSKMCVTKHCAQLSGTNPDLTDNFEPISFLDLTLLQCIVLDVWSKNSVENMCFTERRKITKLQDIAMPKIYT